MASLARAAVGKVASPRGAGRAAAEGTPEGARNTLGTGYVRRDRPVRQRGYHVFRLSLAFRDAMVERRLPEAWLQELAPDALRDGPAIARDGETVRDALAKWLARPGAWDGVVDRYYGPQGGHELLERTGWHAAQHVRQLYAFLERMGVTPEAPLADADFAGLPLPAEPW